MTWPPLPRVVQGLAGPITIDRPLVCDPSQPTNVGLWLWEERRILIRSTLKRKAAWHILLHELTHAALEDAGVTGLTYHKEESVCEAVASGMMHLLRMTHE